MSSIDEGIPNVINTNALTDGSRKVRMVLKIVMKRTWKLAEIVSDQKFGITDAT